MAPPLDGAVNVIVACEFVALKLMAEGVPGTVAGVVVEEGALHVPPPSEFMPRTLKLYEVPLVSPEIFAAVVTLTPSAKVVQLVPLSVEY